MPEIGTCPLDTSPAESYYTSRYSGEQIDQLLTGLSFEIGGSYANLAAIQAAFPNGDGHAYQAADTKNIYVWNSNKSAWESVGQLQGPIGPAAGFGVVTATIDDNVGTPSVSVTSSGENTSKNFAFAFKNLKGERGARGPQGMSGVAMAAKGFYAFNVNAAGHLILSYTGDTAPDFSINADGHLYLHIT